MVRVIPIIDRGPLVRRIAVSIGLFLLCFSLLLFVVLKTYTLYVREGQPNPHNTIRFNTTSTQPDATFSEADFEGKDFVIDVEFLDMKPDKSELGLAANITRLRYTKDKGTLLLGSYKTVPLNVSMYYMEKKITLELTNGDPNKYPYDEYVTEVPFAGYVGASKNFVKYITNKTDVPPKEFSYAIIARAHLQNWKFSLKWAKHDKLQGINVLKIRARRSPTVRLFSGFIIGLMWLVTVGGVLIALQVISRGTKMTPWNVSLFSALLFAMPKLRAVQPNIPPIGTGADILGLFFNMSLLAICQITMMIRWMLQTPGPDDKKDDDDYSAASMAAVLYDDII